MCTFPVIVLLDVAEFSGNRLCGRFAKPVMGWELGREQVRRCVSGFLFAWESDVTSVVVTHMRQ